MHNCDKKVFVKSLQKYKPCVREHGHKSGHTADLKGEIFGSLIVVRLGKSYGRNKTSWVVDHLGFEREIKADSLIGGQSSGKKIVAGYSQKNGKSRPEYHTVAKHHYHIFCLDKSYKAYWGMPFHSDWNPDTGGSFQKGAKWIIENLGEKKGPEWSLDIIEHDKGFVPGNLRWALQKTQSDNRRYIKRITDEQLLLEAENRGYKLVRI